ncbi:hypothetical protein RTBOTA2_000721, partial [Rhodotorula toruloides]
ASSGSSGGCQSAVSSSEPQGRRPSGLTSSWSPCRTSSVPLRSSPSTTHRTTSIRPELGRQACRTLAVALDAGGGADEAGAEVDEGEEGIEEVEEEEGVDEASGTGLTSDPATMTMATLPPRNPSPITARASSAIRGAICGDVRRRRLPTPKRMTLRCSTSSLSPRLPLLRDLVKHTLRRHSHPSIPLSYPDTLPAPPPLAL